MGALLSVQIADEAQAVVAALHAELLLTAASHASATGPRRRPAPPPPALYELLVAERAHAVLQARVDNGDTICGVERRWLGTETEAVYVLERPSGGWDFCNRLYSYSLFLILHPPSEHTPSDPIESTCVLICTYVKLIYIKLNRMTVYIGCIHARRFTPFHTHMTGFYSFSTHDGSESAHHARRFGEGRPCATV
eukprot:COSAG01_NODE_4145_length_5299_cov_27.629423_3_plen_194_part_00